MSEENSYESRNKSREGHDEDMRRWRRCHKIIGDNIYLCRYVSVDEEIREIDGIPDSSQILVAQLSPPEGGWFPKSGIFGVIPLPTRTWSSFPYEPSTSLPFSSAGPRYRHM